MIGGKASLWIVLETEMWPLWIPGSPEYRLVICSRRGSSGDVVRGW